MDHIRRLSWFTDTHGGCRDSATRFGRLPIPPQRTRNTMTAKILYKNPATGRDVTLNLANPADLAQYDLWERHGTAIASARRGNARITQTHTQRHART